MRVKFNTDTKLLYQIGDPLDHACACMIHNTMYDLANINAINLELTVKKGELPAFVEGCKALGVYGFDITTPHKTDIIPLCDEVDEFSRAFRCVNHVKIRDGKLIGAGLDGMGMALAIQDTGVNIRDASLLILGAGAVAGPIAAELCKMGAAKVLFLNRTASKAVSVAETIRGFFPEVEASGMEMTVENMKKAAPSADIVVQCTNLGRAGVDQDYENLDFIDLLPAHALVADVLFNPERTSILQRAEQRGLAVLNGMGMLVGQERAMMKFHFGVELGREALTEGEEALLIDLAMKNLRMKRMQAAKTH